MKQRKILYSMIVILITIALIFYFHIKTNSKSKLVLINDHLMADGLKVGMTEKELITMWGEGEYQPGLGGHFRKYKDKGITIGISGDPDNDLFEAVGYIEIDNKNFMVFDVKTGDKIGDSRVKIKKYGFKNINNNDDTMKNGEFYLVIKGEKTVDSIQLSFIDKDLQDRNY